ncbi:hypothetical protein WR25_11972 [Diploscapter pachys]|uniref:Uncharacterized protein n=1 Tax=Diploscapter pachys TaxID=2018661 RepID=A0A2A2KWX2_9BILA|nr:hypothetical protein WR25_11972 [Diploscapter pachys]
MSCRPISNFSEQNQKTGRSEGVVDRSRNAELLAEMSLGGNSGRKGDSDRVKGHQHRNRQNGEGKGGGEEEGGGKAREMKDGRE